LVKVKTGTVRSVDFGFDHVGHYMVHPRYCYLIVGVEAEGELLEVPAHEEFLNGLDLSYFPLRFQDLILGTQPENVEIEEPPEEGQSSEDMGNFLTSETVASWIDRVRQKKREEDRKGRHARKTKKFQQAARLAELETHGMEILRKRNSD